MTGHPWHAVALATLLVASFGLSGCAIGGGAAGVRLDDRDRDAATCGTGDDNNQCPGALETTVVANSRRGQCVAFWEGWYTGSITDGVRLFARRFDAATGQPEGSSVELAATGDEYPFAATYDPTTESYVVAWQSPTNSAAAMRQVVVQRFDQALTPRSVPRLLDRSWDLKTITPEADGRVAVVGAGNEQPVNMPPSSSVGSLTLRVVTLDTNNRVLTTATRDSEIQGFATATTAF